KSSDATSIIAHRQVFLIYQSAGDTRSNDDRPCFSFVSRERSDLILDFAGSEKSQVGSFLKERRVDSSKLQSLVDQIQFHRSVLPVHEQIFDESDRICRFAAF